MTEKKLIPNGEILISTTSYCGADCIMCPRHCTDYKWSHMGMAAFVDAFEQSYALGIVSLSLCGYGDPLLDPGFCEKVRWVKQKYPEIKITMANTGHLIHGENLRCIAECLDTLKVSMYGQTREVYEKVHRGALKFEQVVANLKSVIALPEAERPEIIMAFICMPENRHEVEAWRAHWEPLVDEVVVWLPHNWAGAYDPPDGDPRRFAPPDRSCGRPFTGDFMIHPDGEVSVCCFDFNKKLVIGDLRQQKLRDILSGPKLEAIRKVHRECSFAASEYICRNCDQTRDREGVLLYASNKDRKVGVITTHPGLISDTYSYIPDKK